MLYGIEVWGNSKDADDIFKLQKLAIRIICKLGQHDSCRTDFKDKQILTMKLIHLKNIRIYIQKLTRTTPTPLHTSS